jgi:hypothetical protein
LPDERYIYSIEDLYYEHHRFSHYNNTNAYIALVQTCILLQRATDPIVEILELAPADESEPPQRHHDAIQAMKAERESGKPRYADST